jgi:hypothetical protein
MILVICRNGDRHLGELVAAAFKRSFGPSQVKISSSLEHIANFSVIVAIDPIQSTMDSIESIAARPGCIDKIILFGVIPKKYLEKLELKCTHWPNQFINWAEIDCAAKNGFSVTPATVIYYSKEGLSRIAKSERALQRFDFLREWNNMRYGHIRYDDSSWSVAMPVLSSSRNKLADIIVNGHICVTYSIVTDKDNYSVLWFNRSSGPIDSFEWSVVEDFLSSYRHERLVCQPAIEEIPWGYDACVTMRLDCDESIETSCELQREYTAVDIPFSLAIRSDLLESPGLGTEARKVIQYASALLSHSHSHPEKWGGTYKNAYEEAAQSKIRIEEICGVAVQFAVSPFHQTPNFALRALEDAGYYGCIGGLSSCDPEFLLAKGGIVRGSKHFVGHSQQHMLHGDCLLLNNSDPLKTSKDAFYQALTSRQIFGYLDHPFSDRYSYGWENESVRIDAHMILIDFIKSLSARTIFLSENDALGFILDLSRLDIIDKGASYTIFTKNEDESLTAGKCIPQITYKGRTFQFQNNKSLMK